MGLLQTLSTVQFVCACVCVLRGSLMASLETCRQHLAHVTFGPRSVRVTCREATLNRNESVNAINVFPLR